MKNPVYAGGGAIAVHEVAKRLTENLDVTVLTGDYPGGKNETLDGVRYIRIGLSSFAGRLGQLFYHFFLPWHVLTKSHDIWVESFTPPFSTSFTPLFTKKPVIGLIHMLAGKNMSRKYHLPFKYVEKIGLTFYRHFIVLTEQSAQEIRGQNHWADIVIIGNGVHSPAVPNNPLSAKYLSYLGRIEIDQKGLDSLIAAYAKIRAKCNIPLLIAGSGSKKEMVRLENLIDLYGLRDSVQLLGRVEGQKKRDFLQSAMVGIVPSRYETFSLVMLEMMSYGIPVVAFDIPGIEWVPKDTLVRVPRFDTDTLSEVVLGLIENSEMRRVIAEHAREYAMARDWSVVAGKYEQYITQVIEKYE